MLEQKEQLKNPITHEPVDEVITEREAKARGYFDFQFLLGHLEDENEYVKYFIVKGTKIIVQMERPHLQYKKKPQVNSERVLSEETTPTKVVELPPIPVSVSCDLGSQECVACSG